MDRTTVGILRELSVERNRWDDPKYLCIIYVKGDYLKVVVDYVNTWYGVSKVDQRGNIELDNIKLGTGGTIKVVNVEDKNHKQLIETCMGLEIATAIVQVGSQEEGFNYWDKDYTCFFPNYVMSRLRTEAKCSTRMVII